MKQISATVLVPDSMSEEEFREKLVRGLGGRTVILAVAPWSEQVIAHRITCSECFVDHVTTNLDDAIEIFREHYGHDATLRSET